MSIASRWSLPGPSRFIERVLEYLNLGQQVIVILPRSGSADNFVDVIGDRLRHDRRVDRIDLGSSDERRLEQQVQRLLATVPAPESDSESLSLKLLADGIRPAQRGLVVDVRSATQDDLAQWGRNLTRYAAHMRAVPRAGPEGVVSICSFEQLPELPEPDVGVHHIWWWGAIEPLDVLVSIQRLRPNEPDSDVRLNTVVELAAFDLNLAELLLREWTGTYSSLNELLLTHGRQLERLEESLRTTKALQLNLGGAQSKDRVPTNLRSHWDAGAVELWGSAPSWHRSALALAAPKSGEVDQELHRLVWRAQVAALIPSVEFARHAIARAAAMEIQKMSETSDLRKRYANPALVEQLDYNELGELLDRIPSNRRSELNKVFRPLRRYRNKLAGVDFLFRDDVLKLLEVIQDARSQA